MPTHKDHPWLRDEKAQVRRRPRMPRLNLRPGEARWAVRLVVLGLAVVAMLSHHGFWFVW